MKKRFISYLVKVFILIEKKARQANYNTFKSKYKIDPTVKFNGSFIKLFGEGDIIIGKNTYIGESSYLQSAENHKITIGSNCAISHNVKIYTTTYDSNQDFNSTSQKIRHNKDVTIGNGVWIGVNVIILPGVTIGDNSIVGSNSVVTKNIENNSVVSGIPAKLLKKKKLD